MYHQLYHQVYHPSAPPIVPIVLQGDPLGPQQADQLPNGPAGLEAAEPGGSFRYMNVQI